MATRDPRRLYDFQNGAAGIDSGNNPSLLGPDRLAFAVNCAFRGGFAAQRPGFQARQLTFDEGIQQDFQTGRFQGAFIHRSDTEYPVLLASISGEIYAIHLRTFATRRVGYIGPRNSATLPKAWFEQVESVTVIQDNASRPWFFDGASLRRSVPELVEVPVGNTMAYGMGRLWVSLPDFRSFMGGDLVYSTSGSRLDALRFTQNTFYNEGGVFTIPGGNGLITAMKFMANLDTSLGQGPLQVFTNNTAFSVNAPFDASTWLNLSYPIQTISMVGYGALGNWSTIAHNGDIFFRSYDGLRSFILARRVFGQWGNVPISRNMNRVFPGDTTFLLPYSSSIVFDNRLITTVAPWQVPGHGVVWRGLGVLDFDPLGSMTGIGSSGAEVLARPNPQWDGVWKGMRVLQLLKMEQDGDERAFAICLNAFDQIELWELTKTWRFDNDTDLIHSTLEFRSMDFGDRQAGIRTMKKMEQADAWVDSLAGTSTFRLTYRADQSPCWAPWPDDRIVCASFQDCVDDWIAGTCPTINNWQEQYRTRLGWPQPPDAEDPADNKPTRLGYEFQPRLEISGPFRLRALRLKATITEENPYADTEKS